MITQILQKYYSLSKKLPDLVLFWGGDRECSIFLVMLSEKSGSGAQVALLTGMVVKRVKCES